jgi:hypothetical protein
MSLQKRSGPLLKQDLAATVLIVLQNLFLITASPKTVRSQHSLPLRILMTDGFGSTVQEVYAYLPLGTRHETPVVNGGFELGGTYGWQLGGSGWLVR